jgi:hypothetical protein
MGDVQLFNAPTALPTHLAPQIEVLPAMRCVDPTIAIRIEKVNENAITRITHGLYALRS